MKSISRKTILNFLISNGSQYLKPQPSNEYLIFETSLDTAEEDLEDLDRAGWELVAVTRQGAELTLILRRVVVDGGNDESQKNI